ncbi:LacI family DNA-binding transcriptional regulator [Weissella confusa]|uniref:LacI family DNA-binding transcriptional regulator n=1 Tax=Weissella confusa TaxID=1583 RepID=UPI0022DFD15A|nr:LacI family DNA-binding transcriptional regulator [Weissella confusa]
MVSLNDVAKAAHVSKMTVSRVLNHPELVSPEIKHDVKQAIAALGYTQNRAGRALANHRHYNIAFVILDDIDDIEPYYAHLLMHLTDELRQYGFTIEMRHDRQFDTTNVDGFLVSGARQTDIAALQLDVPVVIYGMEPNVVSVDIDNQAGTAMATNYLLKQGYQQLLYIGLAIDEPFAFNRRKGYCQTMSTHNLPLDAHEIANNEHQAERFVASLDLHPNTGIIAATDRLALGAIRGIRHHNLTVPGDVGVIGFDGIYLHKMSSPTLTTIQQPLKTIAERMVALLLAQLNGETVTSELIPPALVIGESTR